MLHKQIFRVAATGVGVIVLRFIAFSPIIGSLSKFFSYTNMVGPLTGYFGGIGGIAFYTLIRLLYYKSLSPTLFLVNILPGAVANTYWITPAFFSTLFLPFSCIILFAVHPIGGHAIPYALLWLIPMILFFVQRKTFFLHALCTTFIAHAVGSVFWLYFMPPLPAHVWLMIIPVALGERIAFALGMSCIRMTLIYATPKLYRYCSPYLSRWIT